MNLQKALKQNIQVNRHRHNKATFHENSTLIILRRCSSFITNGIPASKVPAGHKYLQNPGTFKITGIMMTKTASTPYLT